MKFLFVYNKKAGKKFEPSVVNEIEAALSDHIEYEFVDIREVEAFDVSSYEILVAIGGDGTVNTVAKIAVKEDKILGLIPKGSGDGLARFLGISRKTKLALEILLEGHTTKIDTACVDDIFFINVAGAGFEAEVAHKFGKGGIRGLRGYAKTIISSFGTRKEKEVTLMIDGNEKTLPYFSISIANGSQWGNNFEIAHTADIQDGLLDIAIMRKPKWHQVIGLILFFKSKTQINHSLLTYYKASELTLKQSGKLWHLDGEPVILNDKKRVKIHPNSLNVIVRK